MKMLLWSNSAYNGCSSKRLKRPYGQTRPTMDALPKDRCSYSQTRPTMDTLLKNKGFYGHTRPTLDALLIRSNSTYNGLPFERQRRLWLNSTDNGCTPERQKHSYSQTRPIIDALLKEGDAPMVKLNLRWTLSWKTKRLLRSNSINDGCSPERWRRSYGQT